MVLAATGPARGLQPGHSRHEAPQQAATYRPGMAFLDYMDCAKDYMNDLCNDICDIVTKFYPGTPTKAGEDGAESDIAFVYLKKGTTFIYKNTS